MKIMFYTMGLSKGGTERNIALLANEFIKKYDITIVTNNNMKPSYILNSKIKIISIDKNNNRIKNKLSSKRTKELLKIINIEKPNLIIAMLPEASIRVLSLKKKINIPIIISIRNHPKYEFRFIKFIRNYYYKKADLILIQSDKYRKYLKFKNIITIPNFISDEFINYQKNIKQENIIVTVARLSYQKNIPYLINIFSKIKNSNYKYYIYGIGKDYYKINKLIKRKHLENKVILKGNVDNIENMVSKSKLFILGSRYEGMPNCLMEALSLGIPCISTNSSPVIEEIIINNKNGYIVNNKKDFINKINYLLDNKDILNKFHNYSYKIRDIYNKEQVLKKWDYIIEKNIKK